MTDCSKWINVCSEVEQKYHLTVFLVHMRYVLVPQRWKLGREFGNVNVLAKKNRQVLKEIDRLASALFMWS